MGANKSFYSIFSNKSIATYWKDVNTHIKDPIIGTKYFPNTRQPGLALSWIRGRNNMPIALQPSAFDSKASLRDRIGVSKVSTEMPFFREAMRIGEQDRQQIETFLARGEAFARPLIMRVFDDVKNLIDGAIVQAERMRMSLLSTGSILISATEESGRTVEYSYNYDPEGTWAATNRIELTGSDAWTKENASTSSPLEDLWDAVDTMREKFGSEAVEVLCNTTTLKAMLTSESIYKAMNPLGAAHIKVSRKTAKNYVEEETKLTFTVYDKPFKDEQGKDRKFYPDGYLTLLPAHSVGNTHFGTTPEEFDLLGEVLNGAEVSILDTGIALTTIKEPHPVNVQQIVSMIALPSFERMDDIYIMKVF